MKKSLLSHRSFSHGQHNTGRDNGNKPASNDPGDKNSQVCGVVIKLSNESPRQVLIEQHKGRNAQYGNGAPCEVRHDQRGAQRESIGS